VFVFVVAVASVVVVVVGWNLNGRPKVLLWCNVLEESVRRRLDETDLEFGLGASPDLHEESLAFQIRPRSAGFRCRCVRRYSC